MRQWSAAFACTLAWLAAGAAAHAQQQPDVLLQPGSAKPVSPHVYVMMGYPNIAIVVGSKATLAVDTGLGARNGAIVAAEARRLSTQGQTLLLTTTHFHPEHASGDAGFPPGTIVIRPRVQQEELEREGAGMLARFSSRSDTVRDLLKDVRIVKAGQLFERERILDLGGVHVRLSWFGAAHTLGDEIVYVQEDQTLIPGDVVQNKLTPNAICDSCSPHKWLAVLDQIAPLKPKVVVPDHGELGDGGLVPQEQAFLRDLQDRAMALKAQGKDAKEAGRIVTQEFQVRYAGWSGLNNVGAAVEKAYADPS